MAIIVTGSSGHLGEALMRTLRARGEPAIGIDIKPSPFTNRVGSVSDRRFVAECVAGAKTVIHTATLHKPHVATHSNQDFIDTNVTGTLTLLEAATAAGAASFVFTSTTSVFGSALTPKAGEPAAWITEDVQPIAKNIYGVTKLAAESLCELFALRRGLPTIVLRTSRFFPEADDNARVRASYETLNAQANEFLYRRADIADIVDAVLLSVERAPQIGFARLIVSATTPFTREDLPALRGNAPSVVQQLYPQCAGLYAARGWKLFPSIDRVYVNSRAMTSLGWQPIYDFRHVLECLAAGEDFRSPLAREVGAKGYHAMAFDEGPYPVAPTGS